MDKRFFLFLILSVAIMSGYQILIFTLYPPKPQEVAQKNDGKDDGKKEEHNAEPPGVKDANKAAENAQPEQPDHDEPVDEGPAEKGEDNNDVNVAVPAVPLQHVTLGSMNPNSGARMLVTVVNRGASLERIELNDPRYSDSTNRSGYLGFLACTGAPNGKGCIVGIVGDGTPAALAGLKVGDTITRIGDTTIQTAANLIMALDQTSPNDQIQIQVQRGGAPLAPLKATLTQRPQEIIRPEFDTQALDSVAPGGHDQLSLLFTLNQVGEDKLAADKEEFDGVHLRDENWQITRVSQWDVELTRSVPKFNLSVVKRYRLAQLKKNAVDDNIAEAYHLVVDLEIHNKSAEGQKIAYRLDGPTGLPTEGWWYSRKIGRQGWLIGWPGLRDVAMHTEVDGPDLLGTMRLVDERERFSTPIPLQKTDGQENPLAYMGVETQYFAAILMPDRPSPNKKLYHAIQPLVVGNVSENAKKEILTNVTCRLISQPADLPPGGVLKNSLTFFAGPKQRDILAAYSPNDFTPHTTLDELIYYGWAIWGWFATPLSGVLHFFYYRLVGNYGIAIILLTVMVRLCMFPLSRKQALVVKKMQELQPEMKRISEKYKNDMEKKNRALQEMYRKHNYNPLSGCLPVVIQMPIFIGLYRALMTDIELRQAPLLSDSIRWCSNLAAPDMLWHWENVMPFPFLFAPTGFLGPYFNVLPVITVLLFLWQQKMFMPPPTDEQSAMTQKMMKYMMFFMAFMFFKVPSGLCIYFIASSLWSICERKFLPKAKPPAAAAKPVARPDKTPPAREQDKDEKTGSGKKNQKRRKKQRQKR